MAASTQLLNLRPFRFRSTCVPQRHPRPVIIRCSAASSTTKSYNITLLPGDGIGPEVISVAENVLNLAGSIEGRLIHSFQLMDSIVIQTHMYGSLLGIEFKFNEMPMGGAALDLTGVPLPEETLTAAKQSDAVLLGAIGG